MRSAAPTCRLFLQKLFEIQPQIHNSHTLLPTRFGFSALFPFWILAEHQLTTHLGKLSCSAISCSTNSHHHHHPRHLLGVCSRCRLRHGHARIAQGPARPAMIATPQIISAVISRMQMTFITDIARTEIARPTVESDIAMKTTADDHIALDRIVTTIDENVRNGTTVIGRGTESMPAPVVPDMTATRNTGAIDLRSVERRPRNAASAKLPDAPRSSRSSRRAFLTKSRVQPSVRRLQSS